jgi:hypothetical protein
MPRCKKQISAVLHKYLYLVCHSRLDQGSGYSVLDSRFRGNDGEEANVKKH